MELRFGVTVAFVGGMVAATLLSPDAPSTADGKTLHTTATAVDPAVADSGAACTMELLQAASLPWLYTPADSG